MRNKMLWWDESGMDTLIMDESDRFNSELEKLYLEAEEYDFLRDETSKVLTNHRQ